MVALLQPFVPHYREEFFTRLSAKLDLDVYIYDKKVKSSNGGFSLSNIKVKSLSSFSIKTFLFYNFIPLLDKKYDTLILMGSIRHMSTWIVLLINVFLNKKIVLIGHGISVKKYQKEKAKQPFLRWLLYKFAGNALFYYDREKGFFDRDLPSLNSSTFDNTISGADEIISLDPIHDDEKDGLKAVHKISTDINFIFCARFHSKNRKSYLIIDFIKKFDLKKYGLIIIGEGPFKPDFKDLKNVYDYGKLFDLKIKTELFQIADFYFQPSYLGLSGIEGLLFGLPVLTLDRSNNNLHGVEFNNLINGYNAIISDDLDMLKESVSKLSIEDVLRLKSNAKNYSKTKLSMNNSVNKTYKFLEAIRS